MFEITPESVSHFLQGNRALESSAKPGMGRLWTKMATDLVARELSVGGIIRLEARETQIEPDLAHTFLKVSDAVHLAYLCDGAGLIKRPPYFGPEEDAPEHLRNSRPDWQEYDKGDVHRFFGGLFNIKRRD